MCQIKSGISVPMNILSGYSWQVGELGEKDSDSRVLVLMDKIKG